MNHELWTPQNGGFYLEKPPNEERKLLLLPRFDDRAISTLRLESAWGGKDSHARMLDIVSQFPSLRILPPGDISFANQAYALHSIDQIPFRIIGFKLYFLNRAIYPQYLSEQRHLECIIKSPLADKEAIASRLFALEENNQLDLVTIHQIIDYYITIILNRHF
ncbi:MAG: hypothetical protein HYW45_02940 [Candidatus Daviesbacteria bacterium]|nr:MAG: hypothetical protein HYW45_02940 [Candidatus Daviesbacteria bacterium]